MVTSGRAGRLVFERAPHATDAACARQLEHAAFWDEIKLSNGLVLQRLSNSSRIHLLQVAYNGSIE